MCPPEPIEASGGQKQSLNHRKKTNSEPILKSSATALHNSALFRGSLMPGTETLCGGSLYTLQRLAVIPRHSGVRMAGYFHRVPLHAVRYSNGLAPISSQVGSGS